MREQTLVLLKHDSILRGLVGEIIKRFENINLKICAIKMVNTEDEIAENHYQVTEEWANELGNKTRQAMKSKGIEVKETNKEIAERVQNWNRKYLKEGPIIVLVLEGNHAIELVRKIIGNTETRQAPPGTIRGDFGHDSYLVADNEKRSIRNLIHASGSLKEAEREIALWFKKEEIHSYFNRMDKGVL